MNLFNRNGLILWMKICVSSACHKKNILGVHVTEKNYFDVYHHRCS